MSYIAPIQILPTLQKQNGVNDVELAYMCELLMKNTALASKRIRGSSSVPNTSSYGPGT